MKARVLLPTLLLGLALALDAHAVSLTLSGQSAEVEPGAAQALYASTRAGISTMITAVGAPAPDGGTFTDLGVPSMMPDGRVLFGAESTDGKGKTTWDIYYGLANAPDGHRVVRALHIKNPSDECRPILKGDPYPVADIRGSFAFIASAAKGRDALFLYQRGRISCLAYPGARTLDGHEIAILSYGTPQMGSAGEVVFIAFLRADSAAKRAGHRQAILLASERKGILALAVEGELGPNRAQYQRPLGMPAAVASPEGTMVAFSARTPSGVALFLYRGGSIARILPYGTVTPLGPVAYISPGRPGLAPDGTTAVLGACARVPAIFKLARGRLNLTLQRGHITPLGTELQSLSDPLMTAAGAIYVAATDSDRQERVFILGPDGSFSEMGEPGMIYRIAMTDDGRRHSIFTGTLSINQYGDFTYLGGK
jgi:hypothetical protein